MVGGASFLFHLQSAMSALVHRLCDVALICYGSATSCTAGGKLASMPDPQPYESAVQAAASRSSSYALAAARHMHEYGTTREQLAAVAVAARDWARLNPDAFVRDPLTREQVLASRMVSDPLSKADCCLVTDGGGAIVRHPRRPRARPAEATGLRAGHRSARSATARSRPCPT